MFFLDQLGMLDDERNSTVNLTETHVLKINTLAQGRSIIDQEIKQFWDLETLWIKSHEPAKVYERFLEDIKYNGERYEVKLPFKENHPVLPDNFMLSKRRLESQLRRLKSSPDVLRQDDHVIQDQLVKNIIEPVSKEELESGKVHYLPHREVIRLDKDTTKLRVVYDASSKRGDGPSLNDCLYSGPPLTPLIFDVLLRFRAGKVAITADIENAFLNVAIAHEERDYLRFLWIDDILTDNPLIVTRRFTRVVFGENSSPFLLNGRIRHHLDTYKEVDPEFVEEVLRSLYVDDFASSTPNETSGYQLYHKLKQRFRDWIQHAEVDHKQSGFG